MNQILFNKIVINIKISKYILYNILERNNVHKDHTGLCYWTIFQAVGLTCVATIICRSVIYQHGFFDVSSNRNSTSITKSQFCNWHYSLSTVGFIYLYANCKCCHDDVINAFIYLL